VTRDLLAVERQALGEVWRRKKLLALHLGGNAILLGGAYGWLWIAEATVVEVVWSGLLALGIVFAAVWLHGVALAAFHGESALPLGATLRRVHRLLPWALLAAAVACAGAWLGQFEGRVTAWLASVFTLWLRTPVSPRQVAWVYPALLRGCCLVALLCLAPLASQAAGGGRLRQALGVMGRPRYWITCAVLVFAGLYVPGRLVGWVVEWESLAARLASVAVRFAVAYALAVTAWLALAAAIARLAARPAEGGQEDARAPA
jgi:hypothetical protein